MPPDTRRSNDICLRTRTPDHLRGRWLHWRRSRARLRPRGANLFLVGPDDRDARRGRRGDPRRWWQRRGAVVDALDETQVEHADAIAKDGGLDISMNVITHPHTHGTPLWEMDADDYMAPVEVAARTTFITARAASRRMIPRKSG